MRPERDAQGGTWTNPRRFGTPVRFLDSTDTEADTNPQDGQWLPGLNVTPANNSILCHGPMGTAVAEGHLLCEAILALSQGQNDSNIRPEARASCIEVGAYVGQTPDLDVERARAWTALRTSPARAQTSTNRAGTWRHIELGTGPDRHPEFAHRLTRTLEHLGFRHTQHSPDTWPILWIDSRNQPAIADCAAALHTSQGAGSRPWAMVFPGWMGWMAVVAGAWDGDARRRTCLECVREALETGPWQEILNACPTMPASVEHPGKHTGRHADEDAQGIAEHIARAMAGVDPSALLRWWPSDEAYSRQCERIERNPICRVCEPSCKPQHALWDGSDEVDVHAVLDRADQAANPWAGLYARLDEMPVTDLLDLEWGWAWNTTKSARTRSIGQIKGLPGRRHNAGGKGTSRGGARAGAIAEAIERDAIVYRWHQECTRIASLDELEHERVPYIGPETLARFSQNQLNDRHRIRQISWAHVHITAPVTKTDRTRPMRWVEGTNLLDRAQTSVLLPEAWAYIGAPPAKPPEEAQGLEARFVTADTNGCAAGPSRADAAARAYCELIERDAFALWWYGRLKRPGVATDGFNDPWLAQASERFHQIGRTLSLLDATVDPRLPVIIAVGIRDTPIEGARAFDPVCTAGCAPSARLAARRAVTEQVQLGPTLPYSFRSFYAESEGPEYATIARWNLHTEPWLAPDPDFDLRTAESYPPEEDIRGLDFLNRARDVARTIGTSMVALDLTRPRTQLPVVKVAAPELTHFWHRLGHPRLLDGAKRAGWTDTVFTENTLNPVPVIL